MTHCRRCGTALTLAALVTTPATVAREVECPGCEHTGLLAGGRRFGAVFQEVRP
jgi:DNA-directed RNA polymerase subunit RPC12/RpoP